MAPKDANLGLGSFNWPPMPRCVQKNIDMDMFDPHRELFGHSAHMPLMTFLRGKSRRSETGRARRAQNADARGWPASRRHPDWGKGKGDKGKAPGKGKTGQGKMWRPANTNYTASTWW